MTHDSLSTLAGVDLFDLEQCDNSGAREHPVETSTQHPGFYTPPQMRDAGMLDHELNELQYLIFCARRIRRAQEQRDLPALREMRSEIRYTAAHPESLFCRMLANYLAEQDRRTTPWYKKQRRVARRGRRQGALAA